MLPIDLRRFSTAFRFPPLLHFVLQNRPHFVFRIIRKKIYFCAHGNLFLCARKFSCVRTEVFLPSEGSVFPSEGRSFFLRRERNFPALEKEFSFGGKKIFQAWKISPAPNEKFAPCGRRKISVRTKRNFRICENIFSYMRK